MTHQSGDFVQLSLKARGVHDAKFHGVLLVVALGPKQGGLVRCSNGSFEETWLEQKHLEKAPHNGKG